MLKKINISGGIGYDYTVDSLKEDVLDNTGDLEITISSAGGSVYEAFDIYNEINNYKKNTGSKVTVILSGLVASAASYLSMAADERVAMDNSVFMLHNAMMVAMGDHRVMAFWSTDLEQTDKVISKAYAKASRNTIKEVAELMAAGVDNKGTWFYGEEIVENGFADRMIETEGDKNKENSITESKMMFANFKSTIKPEIYDHEKVVAMINTNIIEGEKSMTKKEILDALLTLKTNNGVTLPEVAKMLDLDDLIITDEQKQNVAKMNAVKALCGETDPVDFINGLVETQKVNAVAVKSAKLNEAFGLPVINEKENLARKQAETLLGTDELTEEKINSIKEDPIFKTLAADLADIDSDFNEIGISQTKTNTTADGPVAVTV